MIQFALPLLGGFHAGPLFVIQKQRMLKRPHGKQGMIHRAQTRRATPLWLTDEQRAQINALYAAARRLTKAEDELFVVDHIVPKINPIVCGLHVPWNLRVIHWRANAEKGNSWWPDMPALQLQLELV